MEGQEQLCTWSQDDHRAAGLVRASQAVADLALEVQGSTGSQEDCKSGKVGGRTFPNSNNEIRTAMLIWVANACKLATVRFLSVEKCGEGEEGEAGRTQGSQNNDVLFLLVAFFVDFFVFFFFFS